MAFVTNPPFVDTAEYHRNTRFWGQFQVTQDGHALGVHLEALRGVDWGEEFGTQEDSLPVWNFTLGPRRTTRIQMDYEVMWSGGRLLRYYARPGALWAGKIEHARFALRLGDTCIVEALRTHPALMIRPEGYRWTGEGVEWNFSNWEPTEDLVFEEEAVDRYGDEPAPEPWRSRCGPDTLPSVTLGVDPGPAVMGLETCVIEMAGTRSEPDAFRQVGVRILVDELGRPEDLRLIDSDADEFRLPESEVLRCAWAMRFVAARHRGKPVKAWTTVEVPVRIVMDPR
jgi:hypothetical protein